MTSEEKAVHLPMIQGVITRMAYNSFSLKTVSVALTAAVIAYYGAAPKTSWYVAGGAGASVIVFWLLDAKYLRLERLFRKLYDGVRTNIVSEAFSMDISPFQEQVKLTPRIAFSWSVIWLYLVLIVLLVLVAFFRGEPANAVGALPSAAPSSSATNPPRNP